MWKRHLRKAALRGRWPSEGGLRGAATRPAEVAAVWEPEALKALLQQAAQEGSAERLLLQRLRGRPVAAAPRAAAAGSEDAAGGAKAEDETSLEVLEESALEQCSPEDLLLTAEACSSRRLRDCLLLSALATRLAPELAQASPGMLRRTGSAFATLGVLHPPLFQGIARAWLQTWKDLTAEPTSVVHLTEVARCFAAQRMRHEQLFHALAVRLTAAGGAAAASPAEALSLLHSHAFLRLGVELGEKQWAELEAKAKSAGFAKMGFAPLAELCYVLVLSRRADARQEDVCEMLNALAPSVLKATDEFWVTDEGSALHMRLLLLRSAMRYLYKDAYKTLPGEVVQAFRKVHRMELPRKTLKPAVAFVRKLSENLGKMKIGHIVNAEYGPFVFDVVERDRKIVYECLHFNRFYTESVDKIETMCLQERVAKAMGYRVIQVPHWQWNKIKHRKQRAEYLRMARYYAIKDSRELVPRDEVPTDVALNSFDYLGEYFFRKERPSSAWSWFQPRYDFTKRLPQTTT